MMKKVIRNSWILLLALLMGATVVHAELQLFESWEGKTTVDNQPCTGVLDGWSDTDSDGSGNISMDTDGDGINLTAFANLESNSGGDERGIAVFGVSDPIDDGETGVVFFRFRFLSASRRCYHWFGVHPHNFTDSGGDAIGTGDENDADNVMSAGFLCYRDSTSGPVSIRTIAADNVGTEITTIEAGLWYDCWIDVDNGGDTFDLYLQPSTAPGGLPPAGPTSDPMLDDAPFHSTPPNSGLYGIVCHQPDGDTDGPRPWADRSLRTYLDDIYWDGSQGLVSMTAGKPDPASDAANVAPDKVLSWQAPDSPAVAEILGYDVYLDPNEALVTNRDPWVLKSASQPQTSYDPVPDLEFDTTYYWCVDTTVTLVNDPNDPNVPVVMAGKVWNFQTKTPAPEIIQSPADTLVGPGEPAMFDVVAVSPFALETYQWYTSADRANNTPADDVQIGGAVLATLTVPSAATADEKYYFCKVSNLYNNVPYTVASDAAALAVKRNVAYWTLDALVGGQYEDISGEGHHADPNGSPVFVDGANPALTSNGVVVDAEGGWASVGGWDPSEFSGQLTLSMWVKWAGQTATPAYQGLMGKRSVYASDMRWQLEIDNDPVSATAPVLTFKSNINGVTVSPLPIDEWVQVVVSYDGTTATIYRNGTYDNSAPVTLSYGPTANLMIGAVGQDPASIEATSILNGVLDDIKVYNYALDPVTVAYSFTDVDALGRTACVDPADPVLVQYDLDGDCEVGLGDLTELAAYWLTGQLVPDVVDRP